MVEALQCTVIPDNVQIIYPRKQTILELDQYNVYKSRDCKSKSDTVMSHSIGKQHLDRLFCHIAFFGDVFGSVMFNGGENQYRPSPKLL